MEVSGQLHDPCAYCEILELGEHMPLSIQLERSSIGWTYLDDKFILGSRSLGSQACIE
jgi:hypothetical protein